MLNYVYGHDEAIAKFVSQMIPLCRERGFGPCKAIGVLGEEGRLIAGLVYHHWIPEAGTIEMSGAALPGQQWLTRSTIARMYQYPFLTCRCQMLIQHNSANDMRLLRQLAVYGYSFIKFPRMLGRDHDGVICNLTYEAWAANKFNARFRHHLIDAELEEAA